LADWANWLEVSNSV